MYSNTQVTYPTTSCDYVPFNLLIFCLFHLPFLFSFLFFSIYSLNLSFISPWLRNYRWFSSSYGVNHSWYVSLLIALFKKNKIYVYMTEVMSEKVRFRWNQMRIILIKRINWLNINQFFFLKWKSIRPKIDECENQNGDNRLKMASYIK